MKRIRFGLALSLLLMLSGLTLAQEALTGEQISLQGNGRGAGACSSCHGAGGAGMPGTTFPRIAGLDSAYISAQLQAFREGTRSDPVMLTNALALDEAEITAVAEYYAGLDTPAAPAVVPADEAELARGQLIAERGNWSRYVPSCQSCHGPGGRGAGPDFPPLAGQMAGYIIQQFNYWQDGQRSNDPLGMMENVAVRLSDEDIAAAAAWYASLNPVPAQTVDGGN